MSDALLPCFKCGKTLERIDTHEVEAPPYAGTEFRTYGHYGSTFWDSFDGEEIVLNICDDCLREHTDRLAQHKRYLPIKSSGLGGFGRQWVDRPMVPYTGECDDTHLVVEAEELGTDLPGGAIEWSPHIDEMKAALLSDL